MDRVKHDRLKYIIDKRQHSYGEERALELKYKKQADRRREKEQREEDHREFMRIKKKIV